MNWKSGDIAICINVSYVGHRGEIAKGDYPPLRLNAEYVVKDVYECVKCKRQSLDVGFGSGIRKGILCICNMPLLNNGIYWCASERFVKKGLSEEEEEEEENLEVVGKDKHELLNK